MFIEEATAACFHPLISLIFLILIAIVMIWVFKLLLKNFDLYIIELGWFTTTFFKKLRSGIKMSTSAHSIIVMLLYFNLQINFHMERTKYSVANRIKTIRHILGFKQSAIAAMIKISQQDYCQIENSEDIHTSTLYKVSQALGADAALIVSPTIPINEETVKHFSLNRQTNLVEELLDLRNKVNAYKSILKSSLSDGKNSDVNANNLQAMLSE